MASGLSQVDGTFSNAPEMCIRDRLRTGVKSLLIACAGVFVPLVLGAILYMSFYGFSAVGTEEFYHAVFIGVILTATSVSITVPVSYTHLDVYQRQV